MPTGGHRPGAGRKRIRDDFDQVLRRWRIGAVAHNRLAQRERDEAYQRIDQNTLVERAANARAKVEQKFKIAEWCEAHFAAQRRRLKAQGLSDEEITEIARNTVIAPPPGMTEVMQAASQKVFGRRKRGYREPIRRVYGARPGILKEVAAEHGVSVRMVEACLVEYRAVEKDLRPSDDYVPNPDGDG